MPKAYLKSSRERRVEMGHPWIFRSDIDHDVNLNSRVFARGGFADSAYPSPGEQQRDFAERTSGQTRYAFKAGHGFFDALCSVEV